MTTIPAGTKMVAIATGRTGTITADSIIDWPMVAPKVYKSTKTGKLYTTAKVPSVATMEKYSDSGVAKTPCGCRVEPDGTCAHGIPSWLMIVGVI